MSSVMPNIVAERSAALGSYQPAVDAALAEMDDQEIIRRIWEKDYTVWAPEMDEISNRLGWLHSAEAMAEEIPQIEQFVGEVYGSNINQVLILGMGGSSRAAEFFVRTFAPQTDAGAPLNVVVLDSTDPGAVLSYAEQMDPTRTLFIVASKSGTTVETMAFFRYFYNHLATQPGMKDAGCHFVAITDPGSPLAKLAEEYDFRATFLNDPEIGGRYSALSFFGLVPAALAGIDIERLLQQAREMMQICAPEAPQTSNPATWLGAILGELAKQGRDKLTFLTSPSLSDFGFWLEQLVAESTGKQGAGMLPVVNEPIGLPQSYGDDRLFAYLHLAKDDEANQTLSVEILDELEALGHPVVRMTLADLYQIGGQMFLWELATAIAGTRLNVNPFDQPNVDAAKQRARKLIGEYRETRSLAGPKPTFVFDDLTVFGQVAGSPESPGAVLDAFLGQANPGDYLAIQAYLQPPFSLLGTARLTPEMSTATQETTEILSALLSMCARVRDEYHIAATFGYGPAYLHATGQLHKGDAGKGLFIQFTADHPNDLPVPDNAGQPASSISFGTLQLAQAHGDERALRDMGRQVIRFHLGANSLGWLMELNATLA